jgi:hypothetical protein
MKVRLLALDDLTHAEVRGDIRDPEDQPCHPIRRRRDLIGFNQRLRRLDQ